MPEACMACNSPNIVASERMKTGQFNRCSNCGLESVSPSPSEAPCFIDFSDYMSSLLSSAKTRVQIEAYLTPNEVQALTWIKKNVPAGSPILELCFESGRFMIALKLAGYMPFGLEPLTRPVEIMKQHGFDVAQGFLENFPDHWPDPKCVVILESLVRFPSPDRLLRGLRTRFPFSDIWLSVPSPNRTEIKGVNSVRADYPPHFLTRWTPTAVSAILSSSGYPNPNSGVVEKVAGNFSPRRLIGPLKLHIARARGRSEYSYYGRATAPTQ